MMKKLGVIMMMMCVSVGGALAQKSNPPDNGFDPKGFNNRMTHITPVGASSLAGTSTVEISDEMDVTLKLTYGDTNKKWILAIEDKLGTTDDFTPILNADKWAVDNTLGLNFSYRVGSKRWAFTKDIAALNSIGYSDSLAFDSLAAQKKLSQHSEHWLNGGVKWGTQEFLTLKDSLYVGMDEVFNSKRVNGILLSLSYNASRIFSYKHGLQIAGSVGYTYNCGGTNYEDLKKVEVTTGSFYTDSTNQYLATSRPSEKGRKGVLEVNGAHIFKGDIHFLARPKKILTIDVFAAGEWTIVGSSNMLNIKTGINFGIPNKKDDTIANIGVGVIFKDALTPYESIDDRQDRFVPVFLVGVPIPSLH